MSVVRVHHTKDYTCMSNYHFRDKELSLKAKGLLSLMLSLPDDWDYSVRGLATLSSDGEASVGTAIRELEEHGYVTRTQIKENGKIIDWEYDIYEIPHRENPQVEIPLLENQDNKILKQSNTKKLINTISKDIVDTTKKSSTKKPNLYEKCVSKINDFTDDEILREYLIEFLKKCLENSKESNIPFYTNTFVGKLNSLKRLSDDNYRQREIVLQSLDNGWNGFYQLKKDKQSATKRIEQLDNDTDDTYYKRRKDFMGGINGDTEKF